VTLQTTLAAEILALLDAAPAAIAVQRGPELRWEMASAMYRALLGGHPLVGARPQDVLPDWAQLHRVLGQVMQSGQPYTARGQRFLVDKKGGGQLEEAWFDLICTPLRAPDGSIEGVVTVAVDLTDQVAARQRAEQLAEQLRHAVEARDQFLSVAAHELRTPLTALRLQVSMLARNLGREPQLTVEQLVTRVDKIDHQLSRMMELVEMLLDVTRLQGARLDVVLEEIDLAELAREVSERVRAAAGAAGSSLQVDAVLLRGRWDRSRVDQVVTNLLSNAIKYGAGKPIAVTVARRGDLAAVTVVDQGIGIAAVDHTRIFQRFERAVSRMHFGGLGLGLWISRQLAEAMGGTLEVDSELGRGARFTLLLPL
jgi:signal transduction histidine kinase